MQRERRCRAAPCGANELGDAGEPFFVEVVDGAVVQEFTCQEQRGMHIRRSATSVRRRACWSQQRGSGAAFSLHRGMQQRRLLLVPRRADGGVGGRRRGTTGRPTDGSHLGDMGT